MYARIAVACTLLLLSQGCAKKQKFTGASDNHSSASTSPPPTSDKGKPTDKNKKDGDKPNWLTDPRYKREPAGTPSDSVGDPGGIPGKPGWGIAPPQGGWTQSNVNPSQPGSPMQPAVVGTPPVGPGGMLPPVWPGAVPTPGAVPPGGPGPVPPGGPGGFQPINPNPGGGFPARPTEPNGTLPTTTGGKGVSEADVKEVWIFIENRSASKGAMPSTQEVLAALTMVKAAAAELVQSGSIVLTGAHHREAIWAYEKNALTQGGWVATQNGVENLTAAQLKERLGRR